MERATECVFRSFAAHSSCVHGRECEKEKCVFILALTLPTQMRLLFVYVIFTVGGSLNESQCNR